MLLATRRSARSQDPSGRRRHGGMRRAVRQKRGAVPSQGRPRGGLMIRQVTVGPGTGGCTGITRPDARPVLLVHQPPPTDWRAGISVPAKLT